MTSKWPNRVVTLVLVLLTLPAIAQAEDFTYTTNNGALTITGYTGPGGDVAIPDRLPDANGLPVTCIGENAFLSQSNLTSVTIPSSVTSIWDNAFLYCPSLTAITVEPLNPNYSSVDGVLFDQARTRLIRYPALKAGSYTVPSGVTRIKAEAFWFCPNLTAVAIGNSVTNIGFRAFFSCSRLSTITVDALNGYYSSVDGVLLNKSPTTLLKCPAGKTGNYLIPNGVTRIEGSAFYHCFNLTSVTIPNSVTSIGPEAFIFCASLASVAIGDSVTYIDAEAFYYCASLTGVTIPDSVAWLGGGAFTHCTNLTSVTLGSNVNQIRASAFDSCTNLAGVYFQGNARSVDSIFDHCESVIAFYLPGTTGWGQTFAGRPTAQWLLPYPLILNHSPSFGVQTNQFGFIISWATNLPVVVDACTSLANPAWFPLQTNILTTGSFYFSDADWTNSPHCFYRVRWPGPSAP